MSIDAMKQALAALENSQSYVEFDWVKNQCGRAITALRAAIEQAQGKHEDWCASLTQLLLSMPPKPAPCNCKPRTAPPRQWQGLTDEELNQIYAEPQTHAGQYARAIEAKLKEKNV